MREPVEVCVSACEAYEYEKVRAVLEEQFYLLKAEEVIRPGMRVAVKPNLVTRSTPDESAVTHPVVICAVVSLLKELGASVVIAESPGGPYTPSLLKGIYEQSGCAQAEQYGAELNLDCTWGELKAPKARLCRSFSVITPLLEADAIVDVCKLKTHCMMGMSAAVKNLFGSVPGLMKPELHCRFPEKEPFGTMITDLCQALHPVLPTRWIWPARRSSAWTRSRCIRCAPRWNAICARARRRSWCGCVNRPRGLPSRIFSSRSRSPRTSSRACRSFCSRWRPGWPRRPRRSGQQSALAAANAPKAVRSTRSPSGIAKL